MLDEFDPTDRDPNAYGGIAGTLRLNRTGYGLGSAPKAFKLAKEIRQSKKYKDLEVTIADKNYVCSKFIDNYNLIQENEYNYFIFSEIIKNS